MPLGHKPKVAANVTTIKCTICMQKFAQRKRVTWQGKDYHEDCLSKVNDKAKQYGGVKQKDKKKSMRAV